MPKSPRKKSNISSAENGLHPKCRIPYVPQAIRGPNSYGPLNMKGIEMDDDSDQDTARRKISHIQENLDKSKKYLETINEKIIHEPANKKVLDKPTIECSIDRKYINNPVIVVKKSATAKKLSFNIPAENEKPLHDEHMDWNDYHQLGVIYKFMDDLEADFPSICTTSFIGTSVEGRSLKILKISNSNASNVAVWMDAGIHAREWIAPAVNTYIANHISRNFENLPESVKNKDWYFLPVVNPDGYHYSHTTDRMWRKNRACDGGHCVGVDLNRNFGYGWGGRGSSDRPNNAFYRGPRPFSEPETSAMRDIFLNSGIEFKVYITLHSYGQIIIFPYAFSSVMAPDYVRLLEGATAMSKAIYNTNGKTYKVGISSDVMYVASGTSTDFAHGGAGIPYCYLIELRSKEHKFKLPKEEIEDTSNEILSCVKALMEFVDNSYQNKTDSDLKVDLLLEMNDSFINRSTSCVNRDNSHIKRCDSYSKRNYSYVESSDSSVQNQDSYVRWTSSPMKRDNSLEKTGDVERSDSYKSRNDSVTKNNDTLIKETGTYTKSNDSINKTKQIEHLKDASYDSFLHTNNSFIKKTECYEDENGTYLNETDSSTYKADSHMKREDSYEAWNSFYEQKNNFYRKRNNLFENTCDTFIAAVAKGYIYINGTYLIAL